MPGGLSLTVWSALVVPVPLLGLSLLVDGPDAVASALAGFGWPAAVSTLYTAGLASFVGYGIFNTLLARWPSSAVVPWVLLAPVVAMASAWALLDQRPNAAEAGGGVLLLAGVLVALRPPRLGVGRGAAGRAPRARTAIRRAVKSAAQLVPPASSVQNSARADLAGLLDHLVEEGRRGARRRRRPGTARRPSRPTAAASRRAAGVRRGR